MRPHRPGNLGGNRTESSIVSGHEGITIEEQEHWVRTQANALSGNKMRLGSSDQGHLGL